MNEMNEATDILRYYPIHMNNVVGWLDGMGWICVVWFGSGTELCNYDETSLSLSGCWLTLMPS